jgi:hypothetical protein
MRSPTKPDGAINPITAAVGLEELERWASSGLMWLTGPEDTALGPPPGLPGFLDDLSVELSRYLGPVDAWQLLVDRAAIAGLSRHGQLSCGQRTRLLRAADDWISVSLARPEDLALLPAWLEVEASRVPGCLPDLWGFLAEESAKRSAANLEIQGRLLGLPFARLGSARLEAAAWAEVGCVQAGKASIEAPQVGRLLEAGLAQSVDSPGRGSTAGSATVGRHRFPGRPLDVERHRFQGRPLVVELASLWAGPLCGSLLVRGGARVIKVESRQRPDGCRRGPALFFDLLNGRKESLVLDFDDPFDLELLRSLLVAADVVIEGSRPRALRHLRFDAGALIAANPKIWVSITGYGRRPPAEDWVAFGDDAAVAGGLVVWCGGEPCFVGDAAADPLVGMVAAARSLRALEESASGLIEVPLARVAAMAAAVPAGGAAAPAPPAAPDVVARPPRPSAPAARGPESNEHGDAIRREFAR